MLCGELFRAGQDGKYINSSGAVKELEKGHDSRGKGGSGRIDTEVV